MKIPFTKYRVPTRHPLRRLLPGFLPLLVVFCLVAMAGCGERIESAMGDEAANQGPDQPDPLVQHDLKNIRKSGILRVATFYSPRTYFIHKGGQAGFDFELISRFAEQQNVSLKMVIAEAGDDLVSLLNSGQADVACMGQTPGNDAVQFLAVTRPSNYTGKVVVLPLDSTRPISAEGLAGLTLTLPLGCPFLPELKKIPHRLGVAFRVIEGPPLAEPEELMAQVARHERDAVVVDDIAARAGMAYIPGLKLGPALGERQPTAWLLRRNSPDLLAALDHYLEGHLKAGAGGTTRRSQTYGVIYDRYFENEATIKGFREAAHRPDKSGRISQYDEMIRKQAEAAGLDWRMVAALIYQESRFYHKARSKADARGLMQVLPQFAGPQSDSLYIPEANLRAGLRLMSQSYRGFAYLDSLERWRFTLAVYHAGYGHVTDARRLAMDQGRNPNRWQGSLATALPRLMENRYFRNMRHGYYGGAETVDYVEEIMNRGRMYARFLPRQPQETAPADSLENLLKSLDLLPGLARK